MSTSPKPSPLSPVAGETAPQETIAAFPYESLTASVHPGGSSIGPAFALPPSDAHPDAAAQQMQACARAKQEGQLEARKMFEEQLERERAGLAAALAQFTRDRAVYFQKVEAEVVQLALSIARKILYREAQVDPLLLAGIVRVALEKIDGATGVVLRLHPQNAEDWQRYLRMHLKADDLPEIREDRSQPPDRCSLETSMGSAVIGLEVQLKEIEQGLMDLLAAQPGGASR